MTHGSHTPDLNLTRDRYNTGNQGFIRPLFRVSPLRRNGRGVGEQENQAISSQRGQPSTANPIPLPSHPHISAPAWTDRIARSCGRSRRGFNDRVQPQCIAFISARGKDVTFKEHFRLAQELKQLLTDVDKVQGRGNKETAPPRSFKVSYHRIAEFKRRSPEDRIHLGPTLRHSPSQPSGNVAVDGMADKYDEGPERL
ncbi:hypothetical protein OOU_Y34scaffold00351g1 [Pyricularia oryzae Y34]|uniref:Uncharacterized protein n=2 Tax=Pyricularia oryzae TaxID=318829 RepID=A0AA97P2A8_PYRO3|nr:hypothetical protein OOU_Y34scaffold00351g1 [Pyricularia oryzae Y34]